MILGHDFVSADNQMIKLVIEEEMDKDVVARETYSGEGIRELTTPDTFYQAIDVNIINRFGGFKIDELYIDKGINEKRLEKMSVDRNRGVLY